MLLMHRGRRLWTILWDRVYAHLGSFMLEGTLAPRTPYLCPISMVRLSACADVNAQSCLSS